MIAFVIPDCDHSQRVDTEAVKFVDIAEDMQGRDELTYVCPICGEEHTGLVYGGR
jgi:hypothetical protein